MKKNALRNGMLIMIGIILGICGRPGAAFGQSDYTTPYAFTILAGSARSEGSADGTGSAARFSHPGSVAVDSAGNVYVGDSFNNNIRKITPAGAVSTLAGSAGNAGSADGTGSAARFWNPYGVAVDTVGNVYVVDSENSTIRKITSAGVVSTVAGSAGSTGSTDGTGSAARFKYPLGVAVDGAGNVYVADNQNSTIRKITPAGVVSTLAGSAGSVGSADGTGNAARFYWPVGVAVDSVGNVYVVDCMNHTIRKITSAGVVSTVAGSAGSMGSADGTSNAARFNYPADVAVDSAGNLYVGDNNNHTIRKITPAGVVSTLAGLAGNPGSADGTGSDARFRNPKGMAVDSVGNVYVADNMNHTIRMGWSINHKPVADAGADQTAYEGDPVTLDGSGSHDPDGQSLTYLWEQVAGPPVILNHSDTVNPTFTAPPVPQTGSTLTFQLTVSDGQLISDARTMNVTVKNVNHAPAADAGDDQKLNELTLVTLDGSASYDVDSDSISYSWLQTDGPTVILSDATAAKPFFVAPLVGSAGATFTFELTVDDGLAADTDSVTVKIENANHPPTANAGPDQTVNENGTVTLDGIGSNDPDGDSLTYLWVQTSGPEVLLSDASAAKPTFIAPSVAPGGVELVFDLVVSDGLGGTAIDSVTITVLNVIDPPVAELARANPDSLWPPNHKMVPVSIVGVTDPNNNKVTITILAVTQDEPVNGLGDGDTGPDAIIQGDKMLLRAERSGDGNGRVYHISFIADDGDGGTCAGTVKVSVPRDRRQDAVVDNGPRYNSSQP